MKIRKVVYAAFVNVLIPGISFLALAAAVAMNIVNAQSPVKLKNYDLTIDIFEDGTSLYALDGVASHLGNFTAYGQADFIPGPEPGSQIGVGVVVFEAANGDRLVGVTTLMLDPPGENSILDSSIHFSWQDSVMMRDGTVVTNSGRFVQSRPPGLVVVQRVCCERRCFPFFGCYFHYDICSSRIP